MAYDQHSQPGTNSGHRAACAVEFLATWPVIGSSLLVKKTFGKRERSVRSMVTRVRFYPEVRRVCHDAS